MDNPPFCTSSIQDSYLQIPRQKHPLYTSRFLLVSKASRQWRTTYFISYFPFIYILLSNSSNLTSVPKFLILSQDPFLSLNLGANFLNPIFFISFLFIKFVRYQKPTKTIETYTFVKLSEANRSLKPKNLLAVKFTHYFSKLRILRTW